MRRVILAITSTVAGLAMLLSFKSHTGTTLATAGATAGATGAGTPAGSSAGTGSGGSSSGTSSGAAASGGASAASTVTGDVAQTPYGPVQVRITVKAGRITGATAVQYPSGDPHSQQINAYAIPLLNDEAKQASSASIAMVSGATYTSQGYLASLQTALSRAGLA